MGSCGWAPLNRAKVIGVCRLLLVMDSVEPGLSVAEASDMPFSELSIESALESSPYEDWNSEDILLSCTRWVPDIHGKVETV